MVSQGSVAVVLYAATVFVPFGVVSENWYSGVPWQLPVAVNVIAVPGSCGDAWSVASVGVEHRASRNDIVAIVS